jgi:RluA family pseudouridine synthase
MKKSFRVAPEDAGKRLLQFLRDQLPGVSSVKGIKRAIESKRCRINGRVETFSTHAVKRGDVIELLLEDEKPLITPTILFEDDDLLICNKPAGITCDPKTVQTLFPAFGGRLTLIHRLDKETSGVLLLAKSEEVKEAFIALFQQLAVEKEYLAIVDGEVLKEEGVIDTLLTKKHTYQGQTIYGSGVGGQRAVTHWKCLKRGKGASLLLCSPKTGRTHQLRVHLKEMGHPILGDSQYARHFNCNYPAKRHLLHAHQIRFTHPKTGKVVTITAPLPADFDSALHHLSLK